MTLASAAWGHDGATYNGKDMRELVEAIFYDVPGVVYGLAVSQEGSPGDTVSVAAGAAIIDASGAGLAGKYHVWNDAALSSPTITPTTSNGRKDRLILRVDGTSGAPALEVVEGTPSGSPAEPAITGDNYLELALITLPTSTSNITDAMITDRRVQASAKGGIQVGLSTDSIDDPEQRPFFFEKDTGRLDVYDIPNAAWVRSGLWLTSTGRTGVTARRNANQSISNATSTAITFDAESFDSDGFITPSSTTITIPSGLGGLYMVGWHITGQSGGQNDVFGGYIRVNGGEHRMRSLYPYQGSIGAGTAGIGSGGLLNLSAGDTIVLYCDWNDFSSFTGAQNVTGQLDLYRVGP